MAARSKSSPLERILGRLDDLDTTNLTILVQRLARERELLEAVFNTIREGVLVIGKSGLVEYANAAALIILGLKDDDVGTIPVWKAVPDLARTMNLNSTGLDGSGHRVRPAALARELEITYPEHRFVRIYLTPFEAESNDKEAPLFTMILTDITEDKLSTEQLIQDEKISSIFDLAAGVAHELGNPLNSINIHLQLLERQVNKLDDLVAAKKMRKAVDVCTNEVQRLDGIISNFLQAIRPQALDLQEVPLLDILDEVLNFLGSELTNLNVNIDVTVDGESPVVLGDRNQIKQVFFNVVKNAMEAMDAGGDLRIASREDDEFVFLSFADTGVGIAQEDLSKIFQPYHTTKSSGNGLGMMICRRIMRDHGGQIGLDSRPDAGTVVTLQFPKKHRRMRLLEAAD
ncbi:sensor histidine kinase [Cerasicoccus fimbriatus]|uniref:sensor histidine kinase n=1 Tax=Cerasicoccus fimbriatus TaxID=3014554 RepID=UPI0022B5B424|nr:ATP-binding protein [Cerasicoccus sp. TK19100]